MYPPTLRVHLKDQQRAYLMMLMQCFCVCVCFFPDFFFIKAYIVGIHMNCMDKSMQFKWVPTKYAIMTKVHWLKSKTTELRLNGYVR